MYEDRNMNKGIGGHVVKLDPVVMQEPREENRTREPQSPFKTRGKIYNFACIFIRTTLTQGRMPLNDVFLRQKTSRIWGFQVRFRTLTWHPSLLMGWLRSYALALARLLWGHLEIHRALHVHTLAKILMD